MKFKVSTYIFFSLIIVRSIIAFLGYFFKLFLRGNIIPYLLNYLIIFFAFYMLRKIKVKMLIIGSSVVLILLIGVNTLSMMLASDDKEFYFNSPNNKNALIVEECSFLLGGWSNFYEKKYVIFKKALTKGYDISTDDGYRPFSSNDYSIYWINENEVTINYGYGSNGIRKKVTVDISKGLITGYDY